MKPPCPALPEAGSASARFRHSAIERLRALPAVFSLADLQAGLGLEAELARLYVSRWSRRGLVRRFGGGVYFNLIADGQGPDRRVGEALDKLLRLPGLLVGGMVLSRAGWTTQIHRRASIAVPVIRGRLTVPRLAGDYDLTPRYIRWFRQLRASIAEPEAADGLPGIPAVPPEMALADALLSRRLRFAARHPVDLPPADELDTDELDAEAIGRVVAFMRRLGASEALAKELAAPYLSRFVSRRPASTW